MLTIIRPGIDGEVITMSEPPVIVLRAQRGKQLLEITRAGSIYVDGKFYAVIKDCKEVTDIFDYFCDSLEGWSIKEFLGLSVDSIYQV